ncbi:MAG: hypothetical protein KGZ42_07385 [Melioribacter sp.]|nr:hypothetical protein [Melioribacter sp.]
MPASNDNVDGHTPTFWIRVDAVVELILKNQNYLHSKRTESLVEMVKKQLKVEDRMAKEYIKHAKKAVKIVSSENLSRARQKAILDREALLIEVKDDPKMKLEIMKDRDDLQGLYVSKIKESSEVTVKNIDMSQFTEYGLEKLKRGEKLEDVLLDPKSLKQNADTNTNSSRS